MVLGCRGARSARGLVPAGRRRLGGAPEGRLPGADGVVGDLLVPGDAPGGRRDGRARGGAVWWCVAWAAGHRAARVAPRGAGRVVPACRGGRLLGARGSGAPRNRLADGG